MLPSLANLKLVPPIGTNDRAIRLMEKSVKADPKVLASLKRISALPGFDTGVWILASAGGVKKDDDGKTKKQRLTEAATEWKKRKGELMTIESDDGFLYIAFRIFSPSPFGESLPPDSWWGTPAQLADVKLFWKEKQAGVDLANKLDRYKISFGEIRAVQSNDDRARLLVIKAGDIMSV